jgi:hypothetical protein
MKTKFIILIVFTCIIYNVKAQDINSLPHFNYYYSDHIIYVYIHPEPLYLPWGGYGIEITDGNGAHDMYYGKPNTDAIISQLGDNEGEPYPALVCDTLTAFGYTDWYLPAHYECALIKGKYEDDWNMPFADDNRKWIWSSNEFNSTSNEFNSIWAYHWILTYTGGEVTSYNVPKSDTIDFTCIRREYVSNSNTQTAEGMFSIFYTDNIKSLHVNIKNNIKTTIIKIFDTSGKQVMHKEIKPKTGEHTELINTSGFANSAYIIHVSSGEINKSYKFIVE